MPKQTFFNLPQTKQALLIDLAITEFSQHDYKNGSVRRIIEKSGIAPGSFYQYFANKEDLYSYLFVIMADTKRAFFLENGMPDPPPTDIFEYLRRLAEVSAQFEVAYPQFSQLAYRALKNNSFPEEIVAAGKEKSDSFLHDLIAQGKAQGVIATEYDDELVAFLFTTIMTELSQFLLQKREEEAGNGERPFLDPTAPNNLFAQTMTILQFGLQGQKEYHE